MLGQFGANREAEPPILPFDDNVKEVIEKILCETDANIVEIQ